MALQDIWKDQGVKKAASGRTASAPVLMQFKFLPNGQVVMFQDNPTDMLNKSYLGNHAVFAILDWIAQKVASAPVNLYEVKDEKAYKNYKGLMKGVTDDSLRKIRGLKSKALHEVLDRNHEIMNVFKKPNPNMSWFEFAYGQTIYKNIVGSSYWSGVRAGSVNDKTIGKIKEIYLPPAQQMTIVSGGSAMPIKEYFLTMNPEEKINALNVFQNRNFSPQYDNPTQALYGLSKLHAAKPLIEKFNEATKTETSLYKDKGVRDLIFAKQLPAGYDMDFEELQKTNDAWTQKINEAGSGGILISQTEVGSLRIGFSPEELGILESQAITKVDFCAIFHVSPIIFGWNENTTFNNMAESRKTSLIDAVLPELEAMISGLNTWYLPSYDDSGRYVLEFDLEYFAELQDDLKETVLWLKDSPLTANEFRQAIGYDASPDENADKVMIRNGYQLLENLGVESYAGDLNAADDLNADEQPSK